MDKAITDKTIVQLSHSKLGMAVTGYANVGESKRGTTGVWIFIPTSVPKKLIDLIKA